MNVGILDDETHCVKSLEMQLSTLFPDLDIVFKSTDSEKALKEIPDLSLDLLFLDIQMPVIDGFEFLDRVRKIDFDIIFTTAYSEYAIKAFRARAINYLLKPIDDDELKEAIKTYSKQKQDARVFKQTEALMNALAEKSNLKEKIAVPVTDGMEFIVVKDIIFCQSQSNYTLICLQDGREIMFSKTLKETEDTLAKFGFLRIHQSYLVNPLLMKKYNRNDGGHLIMDNDKNLSISKKYRKVVSSYFEAISSG